MVLLILIGTNRARLRPFFVIFGYAIAPEP
jgi:hypothetical protein